MLVLSVNIYLMKLCAGFYIFIKMLVVMLCSSFLYCFEILKSQIPDLINYYKLHPSPEATNIVIIIILNCNSD